jgi:hypothetical protein
MALVWFTPLLEHQSPLFNNFEAFLRKFNATFGDFDKEFMSSIKIRFFCQGPHSAMVYVIKAQTIGLRYFMG